MLGQGFILSAHSYDVAGQACIELWLSTDEGPYRLIIDAQRPNFFIHAKHQTRLARIFNRLTAPFEYKDVDLRDFNQQAIGSCYFSNNADFYSARKLLQQSHIDVFEDDFRLHQRYLMERFIKGSASFIATQVEDLDSYHSVTQTRLKPSDYQPKLRLLSFDVECSMQGELYSIGFYAQAPDQDESLAYRRVLMIGEEQAGENWIDWLADEKSLLEAFIQVIAAYDPDVLIGWNVVDFDCRLLLQRAELHGVALTLGRDGSEPRWRDNPNDVKQGFITLAGRVVIDGIAALKAATYSFSSFSLENVSRELLGRGKKIDAVDQRTDEIDYNFKHNKVKLAAYNLEDCKLVWDIFQVSDILDYLIFRSQLTGLAMDKIGGSVAAFTNLYLPKLHRAGYIAPNLPAGGGLASPGGYVMESRPGLYKNVLVLDFKSLYPSIIRTFKVDPLGLIEGLNRHESEPDEVIEGYLGAQFSRQIHLLPEILTQLWQQRDLAKQADDLPRSQAIKIIMSSFYGVLGSGGCRFYDPRLASSITLRGHFIMQTTAALIQAQGYEVIYGDTDSTFVLLGDDYNSAQANTIGSGLAEDINEYWQAYLEQEFSLDCHLEIEFETHYRRFLMPKIRGSETGSKKRYAGLVGQGEQAELVFKGLESVRTDWTELAKVFQTRLYQMVFDDRDPSAFIREFVSQTLAAERDQQLVYRKRLRQPLSEYKKNIPPHVRAAIEADKQNQAQALPLKYQDKGWISYVMTLQGPQAIEYQTQACDYNLYIERQLKAVADAILPFIGLSFDEIISQQMGLF